eukprot:1191408-Prorocentrum_minimum.AAC.1
MAAGRKSTATSACVTSARSAAMVARPHTPRLPISARRACGASAAREAATRPAEVSEFNTYLRACHYIKTQNTKKNCNQVSGSYTTGLTEG